MKSEKNKKRLLQAIFRSCNSAVNQCGVKNYFTYLLLNNIAEAATVAASKSKAAVTAKLSLVSGAGPAVTPAGAAGAGEGVAAAPGAGGGVGAAGAAAGLFITRLLI